MLNYCNTPYDIITSRLDFSVWKRMKNLAINLQPLIYGAFPVCRNYTVRAHLRNLSTSKRSRRKNRQQYARPLRCGIHPANLHSRHKEETGRGRTNDGQLHGTSNVSKKYQRGGKTSSPVLLIHFSISSVQIDGWLLIFFACLQHGNKVPKELCPVEQDHNAADHVDCAHGLCVELVAK